MTEPNVSFKRVDSPLTGERKGLALYMLVESLLDTLSILSSVDGDIIDQRAALRWTENVTNDGDETLAASVAWELANAVAFHASVEDVLFAPTEPARSCSCPINHVRQAIAYNEFLDAAHARANADAVRAFMREARQGDNEDPDPARNITGLLAGYLSKVADSIFAHRVGKIDIMPPVDQA